MNCTTLFYLLKNWNCFRFTRDVLKTNVFWYSSHLTHVIFRRRLHHSPRKIELSKPGWTQVFYQKRSSLAVKYQKCSSLSFGLMPCIRSVLLPFASSHESEIRGIQASSHWSLWGDVAEHFFWLMQPSPENDSSGSAGSGFGLRLFFSVLPFAFFFVFSFSRSARMRSKRTEAGSSLGSWGTSSPRKALARMDWLSLFR